MRIAYITLLVALLTIPAIARADEIPGPPLEKRAWLGVSVAPPPAALRHQLSVPDGIGLVVDFVIPKAPADQSGLQPYDLLTKIDDQWLVNTQQFAVLVRMHHAGDQVKLTYFREGKEQTATATLVDHEVPRPGEGDEWPWPGQGLPPLPGRGVQGLPQPHFGPESTITWLNGNRQISIDHADGHMNLTVTDPHNGKIILQSPIDTQEQRDALPQDIREVVKKLLRYDSNGEKRSPSAATTKPAE